ncbi:hypothetical protein SUGI_0817840 [Cryptomeria japonica]|nr:hypothetical protein SUGI_0817840 [Cryptomeria japonica]
MSNTSVTRDTLVGKLSAFEIEEFGPVATIKTDLVFKASTSSASSFDKSDCKAFYSRELEEIRRENEELEELEALFARKMPKDPIGSKYEEDQPVEKALTARIEDKNEWIIDSGCSNHMTGDKSKFLTFQEYNGGLVRFGDDKACLIKGKGTISLDGNIFHLNNSEKTGLIAHIDESWLWHKRLFHVNFDCIVKISTTKAVRDLPRIVKPHNPQEIEWCRSTLLRSSSM